MNKVNAYAELLLNSDAENEKYGLTSNRTSAQLFELGQEMTREEIKEAIALYHKIKPQKQ
jgi:hypothetical protein